MFNPSLFRQPQATPSWLPFCPREARLLGLDPLSWVLLGLIAGALGLLRFLVHRQQASRDRGEDPGRVETRRVILRLLANDDETGLAERRHVLLAAISRELDAESPRIEPSLFPRAAEEARRLVISYRRDGADVLTNRDVAILYYLATAPGDAKQLEDLLALREAAERPANTATKPERFAL